MGQGAGARLPTPGAVGHSTVLQEAKPPCKSGRLPVHTQLPLASRNVPYEVQKYFFFPHTLRS